MKELFEKEHIRFKAARSGGPGGQNVNKRSTKVQLWLPVEKINISDKEKEMIREKLNTRITQADEIEITSEEERSQEENRKRGIERLNEIIKSALLKPRRRIPTKVSKTAEAQFQEEKKAHRRKKSLRKLLHHTILEE